MDWDKLRIFHAVAEAGSFTHAGESLNLSQSAVSRQVSSLEQSLNLSGRHEIEHFGEGKFNDECRAIVLRYTKEWRETVERRKSFVGKWYCNF